MKVRIKPRIIDVIEDDGRYLDKDMTYYDKEDVEPLDELPEGLEEAAKHHSEQYRPHWPNQVRPSYDSFIAGAKLQKEQMLKEAVECDVIVPIYEGNDVWSAEIKIPGRYEIGDKVRVIVIPKTDEK